MRSTSTPSFARCTACWARMARSLQRRTPSFPFRDSKGTTRTSTTIWPQFEADVLPLLEAEEAFTRGVAQETAGLIELVRYLGLPPRDGPFGRTGFGLKIPMLVNSFVRQGFTVESVEVIEPFTFPIGLLARIGDDLELVKDLGAQVMSIKRRYLTSTEAADPYLRPPVLADMIAELRTLVPVSAVPIARVVATKR